MDSWVSWLILLVMTMTAGWQFIRYAISEYDKYLYNRQHGWQ